MPDDHDRNDQKKGQRYDPSRRKFLSQVGAALAGGEQRFAAARARVNDGEARVDDALATFALLGFQPA